MDKRASARKSNRAFSAFSRGLLTIVRTQSRNRYWRNYYDNTDALVYVVDSADQARLDECQKELGSLLKEPKLQGVPLLVFANKQDLLSAMESSEIADALSLNDDRAFQIQACSAKTGDGLNEG